MQNCFLYEVHHNFNSPLEGFPNVGVIAKKCIVLVNITQVPISNFQVPDLALSQSSLSLSVFNLFLSNNHIITFFKFLLFQGTWWAFNWFGIAVLHASVPFTWTWLNNFLLLYQLCMYRWLCLGVDWLKSAGHVVN